MCGKEGGGACRTKPGFQFFEMLSPNKGPKILKSSSYMVGLGVHQQPGVQGGFDAKKVQDLHKRSQRPYMMRDVCGGPGVHLGNQLPSFDVESKSAKIPKTLHGMSCVWRGGRGPLTTNFQLLMLSPNLLKS